ncbi:hypothetical protein [Paraliomyxa miuraensis]|uniref:hypothetical protein n=1 Tax=Paraliomyxa miuraensis TaxID=376150 RepID=UPI00224FDC5A|nr:hypothetical protein [Paraliomyxa miuraensis]MCX4243078.1 hypothetical protein [Paraliomyxa miuraensis]
MRAAEFLVGSLACLGSFLTSFEQRAPFELPVRSLSPPVGDSPVSLEWSAPRRPGDLQRWRESSQIQSTEPRARTLEGDWSWLDTAALLQDPYFVAEQRRACDATHGAAIEGRCWYTFHYVLAQVDDGHGKVVHVKAELRGRDDFPAADAANDPHCHDYVGCLARARLGATIPLPAAPTGTEVAIHEHMQSAWGVPSLYDPKQIPALIELWDRTKRRLARQDAAGEIQDPKSALHHRFITSLVPYLHEHLQRVEQGQEQGP